jgi:hypothetical protein
MTAAHCGNCGAGLHGPYCSQCGQHAHASARQFGALLHDGWHTFTHLDGRFWATFWALLLRPGFLTTEYFAERRQRYLPPVRLYLVLSILFFALVSFGLPQQHGAAGVTTIDARPASARAGTTCDLHLDSPWLNALAEHVCERARHDQGASLLAAFQHNVPRMMFVFLPLLAVVMLLLYWRPRQLYVQHLVFFLHNHSALFLAFILLALVQKLAGWFPVLEGLSTAGIWALCFYSPWYVYMAMRRVYGQGRLLTLAKLGFMSVAYVASLLLTLTGTALVSVLQA